jgi:superfamily II DNA or RNA helicase
MQEFAEKRIKAIVAPKILDEGIDFPDADLAIVLAASSTRRQMVQRMGRVLRPKSGGKLARFVVVFASNTVEDPMFGGHSEFINDLRSGASVSELVESHEIDRVLEILKSIRIS